jgi:NAD(P)-dependent dehydrogenase (short-subunit alcohol dehydrogenase family)
MAELAEQVALVTGSSGGVGAAVARMLSALGVHVVINSRTSAAAGEALAAALRSCYVQADVSDPVAARALVEGVAATHGRLDIVVNNAATTDVIAHDDLDSATPEVWQRILATNVVAPFVVTGAARPWLEVAPAGGVVVNIGSVAGVRPGGSSIPYAVSKAGLHHQTKLLAIALAPRIRVNAVAPGMVETDWVASSPAARETIAELAPLRRNAEPDDVAEVVLAQIRSGQVTGEVWVVDGGFQLVR